MWPVKDAWLNIPDKGWTLEFEGQAPSGRIFYFKEPKTEYLPAQPD